VDTIEAMTGDEIAGFFADHYRPANMVVAAAGAVDHDRLVARLAAASPDFNAAVSEPRTAPTAPALSSLVVERPTEQVHVAMGVPGLDRDDPDRYALALVDIALGGGMSSRLFQEVREERGLAYSVYSFRAAFEDSGMLGVYAGTAPERADEVIKIVNDICDRMAAEGPTEREVAVGKGQLRGSMLMGLEDSGGRMSRIGRSQLVHGEVPTVDEVLARVDAVTLDDARAVAARVLGGTRSLAVVGPRSVSL
jgi:predicted Zn-dependent peptidase